VQAAANLGWITLDVPAGTHTVRLQLGPTPIRALAEAVSLLALALPLTYLGMRALRARRSWKVTIPRVTMLIAGVFLSGAAVLVAGALLLHAVRVVGSRLRLSVGFASLIYLHHA